MADPTPPPPPPRMSPAEQPDPRGTERPFIARWDLDKTYLRTDFDTARDLLRTALQRPDQKRTVPGAAALLRELGRGGVQIHILSGSPEQLRSRLEEKLRLDGARWASLTLKPNLENLVRLRFRAIRGQLGYKLPALLRRRCEMACQLDATGMVVQEVLLGDDAEADAFVYSLYADVCSGQVGEAVLAEVLRLGGSYEDGIRDALRYARAIVRGPVVQRILIHLDRQSSPSDFWTYGPRVVPFYNYFQAAWVLFEDGRLSASQVLNVAADLITAHNFDAHALGRSFADLARRGHTRGLGKVSLRAALDARNRARRAAGSELEQLLAAIAWADEAQAKEPASAKETEVPYLELVVAHNRRRKSHTK